MDMLKMPNLKASHYSFSLPLQRGFSKPQNQLLECLSWSAKSQTIYQKHQTKYHVPKPNVLV
jgi:hypothetical protein